MPATNGNAFLHRGGARGRGRGGTSDTGHVDEEEALLVRGPLAEEERRTDVTKTMGGGRAGTRGGMINTRALFSDFLPRDPRAQIACK